MIKKIIMGIDPGTTRTGYGILEIHSGRLYAVALGDIDLRKAGDTYQKLRIIFERVGQLIDGYHPDEVALESPFFGENVQSMLKLGRAQGVAMAAALSRGLNVYEYAPRRVKQAITGRGGGGKGTGRGAVGKHSGHRIRPETIGCDRRNGRGAVPLFCDLVADTRKPAGPENPQKYLVGRFPAP